VGAYAQQAVRQGKVTNLLIVQAVLVPQIGIILTIGFLVRFKRSFRASRAPKNALAFGSRGRHLEFHIFSNSQNLFDIWRVLAN
jgi:hypothetical protein